MDELVSKFPLPLGSKWKKARRVYWVNREETWWYTTEVGWKKSEHTWTWRYQSRYIFPPHAVNGLPRRIASLLNYIIVLQPV